MKPVLGALLWCIAFMAPSHADVPADRLATLSRGVNLVSVFTNRSMPAIEHDLTQIQAAGLRHVRIFVDPELLQTSDLVQLNRLDGVVQSAVSDGLGVILCMNSFRHALNDRATPADIRLWQQAWTRLAQRYGNVRSDKLFYELANEPTMEPQHWNAVQDELRQRVRTIAPHTTLLLTGSPVSTVWALPDLKPAEDSNVVYTFHLYQPMAFTHQGADWDKAYQPIKNLTYPPSASNVDSAMRAIPPSVAEELVHYKDDGADAMAQELAAARTVASQRGLHLAVTEFGVYRSAPPTSRALWLSQARRGIEAAGFGWTVWEYDGGFGIEPDLAACTAVVDALGLQDNRPGCHRR